VDIEANDSTMLDAVLAHRVGLLPIRADPEKFEACLNRKDLDVGRNAIEFVLNYTAKSKVSQIYFVPGLPLTLISSKTGLTF
jgi:hypothetical protein